jgi:hypothetical protein
MFASFDAFCVPLLFSTILSYAGRIHCHNKPRCIWQRFDKHRRDVSNNCQIHATVVAATFRGGVVNEKTAVLLADAFEGMLAEYQMSATELFEIISDAKLPPKGKKWVRLGFMGGLKNIFLKMPELPAEKVSEALALLDAFRKSPHKMRKLLAQTVKTLPHAPGGPPKKIKPDEERTVCLEIEALRAEYDTREAIRRVAAKRHVSERTVYRIWGKYHPKKTKSKNGSKVQTAVRNKAIG